MDGWESTFCDDDFLLVPVRTVGDQSGNSLIDDLVDLLEDAPEFATCVLAIGGVGALADEYASRLVGELDEALQYARDPWTPGSLRIVVRCALFDGAIDDRLFGWSSRVSTKLDD